MPSGPPSGTTAMMDRWLFQNRRKEPRLCNTPAIAPQEVQCAGSRGGRVRCGLYIYRVPELSVQSNDVAHMVMFHRDRCRHLATRVGRDIDIPTHLLEVRTDAVIRHARYLPPLDSRSPAPPAASSLSSVRIMAACRPGSYAKLPAPIVPAGWHSTYSPHICAGGGASHARIITPKREQGTAKIAA